MSGLWNIYRIRVYKGYFASFAGDKVHDFHEVSLECEQKLQEYTHRSQPYRLVVSVMHTLLVTVFVDESCLDCNSFCCFFTKLSLKYSHRWRGAGCKPLCARLLWPYEIRQSDY